MLPLRTWKRAVVFAVVGGLMGAAYAHHRAARVRIAVNLRPVDQMPVSNIFITSACLELMDADKFTREQLHSRGMAADSDIFTFGNCFIKSKSLFKFHLEGNNLFVEYERGNEKGFASAKALTDSPHEIELLAKHLREDLPEPSVVEPVFAGVAAALLLATFLQIARHAVTGRFL